MLCLVCLGFALNFAVSAFSLAPLYLKLLHIRALYFPSKLQLDKYVWTRRLELRFRRLIMGPWSSSLLMGRMLHVERPLTLWSA